MGLEAVLIVGDSHHPFEDKRAWKLMLKVAADLRPKHIICIGDLVDFYSVSHYSKDPSRLANLPTEVAAGNAALSQLDALKAKNKLYCAGNHEDRLQRYLQDKAPDLFEFVSVPKLLRLKERGWKYVPYKGHTKIGKLNLTHDVGTAGRYAAHRALDMFQHSVVTGHTHRLSYVVEGNAVGETKLSASFGWLGDAKQIDYMHAQAVAKNWALGFGAGYMDPATGIVYLTPVPIVGYTAVWNSRLYKG